MSLDRKINFAPGPSKLPEEVLSLVKEDIYSVDTEGVGIFELGHRSKKFGEILDATKALLKDLMSIPESFEVLFMTGGASTQFSAVPLNMLHENKTAYYLVSGRWSQLALSEAKRFGAAKSCGSSESDAFSYIPKVNTDLENASYVHFTSNNTIYGTQFSVEPDVGNVPLVCDASSDICSRRVDFSKYALMYAGAQKQLGAAGVTLVILNLATLSHTSHVIPKMLNYETYVNSNSLSNTPPVTQIVIMNKMLEWLNSSGGLPAFESMNAEKAKKVYDVLDASSLYEPCVKSADRSLMNITFRLQDSSFEDKLISFASERNIHGIKGHRLVGGFRVSLYNAITLSEVEALTTMLQDFERKI